MPRKDELLREALERQYQAAMQDRVRQADEKRREMLGDHQPKDETA